MAEPILSVRDLSIEFDTRDGVVRAVNGVSFDLYPGEALGVVGESGSGKSVSAMSILGLIPRPFGHIVSGEVTFQGRDVRELSSREIRAIRGRDIAMVFQDPMTSLNPVMTIGAQIAEAIKAKDSRASKQSLRGRIIELLELVEVPDPEKRLDQYPHQFSGGMRQRATIAMAMANDPKILIADEPTTALDVTIQAQVLEVLRNVQQKTRSALVLITHDLGTVAEVAERVVVMYGGRVVEEGPVDSIFEDPQHPYTLGLLTAMPRLKGNLARLPTIKGLPPSAVSPPPGCPYHPRCDLYRGRSICRDELPPLVGGRQKAACHFSDEIGTLEESHIGAATWDGREVAETPAADSRRAIQGIALAEPGMESLAERASPERSELLRVTDLKMHFPVRSRSWRVTGRVRAVDGINLSIDAGETLGLVGESGSGKSTTGKTIMRLLDPTDGQIVFQGRDITHMSRRQLRALRRDIQMVFQDPFSSLDPRMTVRQLIGEPLRIHGHEKGREAQERIGELMELVGLSPEHGGRYAYEFSGGQRQRISIARAIALEPSLLILDEPVSSLDVSIQAQIINLLMDLQDRLGMAYLFIAHDLAVVRQISHRVAVMYLGKIVEYGDKHDVYELASHPYTQSLLSAVPVPNPAVSRQQERIVLSGDIPNPAHPPSGCNFRTRCFKADDLCAIEEPALVPRSGHDCACHFAEPLIVAQTE